MPDTWPTTIGAVTVADFGERLASAEPVPGGGSASAVVGSLATALVAMVARLSTDRPRYAEHGLTHERALTVAEEARGRFLRLADEDAAAYGAFAAALRLPRDSSDRQAARQAAMRAAAREATLVPLEILRLCRTVAEVIEPLAGRSNVNAASDLDVAAHLIGAAAAGAAANVRINLPGIGDPVEAERLGRLAAELEEGIRRDVAGTHTATGGPDRPPEPEP